MSSRSQVQIKPEQKPQRKSPDYHEPSAVRPIVHEVLRSPGQPLDSATRTFMEPRFGHDFGRVRVHIGAKAGESAQMLNAKAYTVGRHIIFGRGHYAPGSPSGKTLIAHEVTHVMQQVRYSNDQSNFRVIHESHPSETEAERTATNVLNDDYAEAISPHPIAIHRKTESNFDLIETASPFMASALGSVTIDGFETAKAEISTDNEKKLKETAKNIIELLKRYPGSTVRVIGHTDAIDSEHYNLHLGWERAESTRNKLKRMGVPEDLIKTESKGELELLVETLKAEPRNRRVEVRFEPFVSPIGALVPELSLTPPEPSTSTPEVEKPIIPLYPPPISGYPPWSQMEPHPPVSEARRNWLEEGLKGDPVIRKLPDWARERVIDAVKDADEKVAEGVIDALPLEAKEKEALKAVVKSILQLLKGKRFEKPTPPLHEPPPPPFKDFQKMPGEKIFKLPPIRF